MVSGAVTSLSIVSVGSRESVLLVLPTEYIYPSRSASAISHHVIAS